MQSPVAGGGSKVEFRLVGPDGQLVRDLKPEEVTLRVDGKPRTIRSLELVDLATGAAPAAVRPAAVPPPFASNDAGTAGASRDVLLLFDEESVLPGRDPVMRGAAEQLIAALSPRHRVGVLSVRQGGPNVAASADPSVYRAAVAKVTGYSSGKESDSDLMCRTSRAVGVLNSVFSSLAGGAPTTVVLFSTSLRALEAGRTARIGEQSALCQLRLEELNRLADAAGASGADFYAVELTEALSGPLPAEAVGGLENLAGVLSGEHIRLSGTGEAQMGRLAHATAAHYIATFEPESSERTGASRRVEVRVAREGTRVRARPELVIAKSEKVNPRDMIRTAAAYRDLPLHASAFSSRNASGDDKIKVLALFEPADPNVTLAGAIVGLFDEKGKLTAQWSAQRDDLARRPVMAAVTVPAGKYRLRVAATDSAGRGGAVDQPVDAALVTAGSIQLSDLMLGTAGETAAPAMRFGSETAAVAMVELYGRPTSPLKAYIEVLPSLDGERLDAIALAPSRTNEQDRFVLSAAIPLEALAPGDYVIRATVAVEGEQEGQVMHTLRKGGS